MEPFSAMNRKKKKAMTRRPLVKGKFDTIYEYRRHNSRACIISRLWESTQNIALKVYNITDWMKKRKWKREKW